MERVAKIMARRGLCSRREAERLIAAGEVQVNGVIMREQGCKAPLDAEIVLGSAAHAELDAKLTVLLHKPVGIVSTLPEPGQTPAWRLLRKDAVAGPIDPALLARIVAESATLSVAGRLDRNSRGLLLLTQDGTVARRLVGGNGVEKTYLVRTAEPVTDSQLGKLRGPLRLDDQALRPMRVERVESSLLRFGLVEGRNHQLRRVCRHVGLYVVDLLRTGIGPFSLAGLAEGRWRVVGSDEVRRLLCQDARDV